MTWSVTTYETIKTVCGYATRAEAEAKGRALLAKIAEDQPAEVRTVLVSRDTGPREPGQESDPLYFLGRWDGRGLVDEAGQPLTL